MSILAQRAPRILVCSVLMLSMSIGVSSARAQTPSSIANMRLQDVLEEDGLPSISVAIAKDGEVVYSSAFGLADLESRVAATANTKYQIGSITKTFTAIAALQLVEQGTLILDEPVQNYCEQFPVKQEPITTYQLLSHTAGIRHYDYRRFDEDFLNKVYYDSTNSAILKFKDDSLVSDPGSSYFYSSWGYVLAGCVIEGAGNLSYMDSIELNVLDQAGLSQTEFDVLRNIIPNRSRGYSMSDTGALSNVGLFDASDRYPAGGILSTPTDLVKFGNAILSGDLIGEQLIELMWSPSRLSSGEATQYGLGWNVAEDGEEIFHGGTSIGSTSYLYVQPRRGVVVAIITNLALWPRNRHELAQELASLF